MTPELVQTARQAPHECGLSGATLKEASPPRYGFLGQAFKFGFYALQRRLGYVGRDYYSTGYSRPPAGLWDKNFAAVHVFRLHKKFSLGAAGN